VCVCVCGGGGGGGGVAFSVENQVFVCKILLCVLCLLSNRTKLPQHTVDASAGMSLGSFLLVDCTSSALICSHDW
jgi:hypothetical protein